MSIYAEFADAGYNVVYNNKQLQAASNDEKTLGIFSVSNMAKWLDRNVCVAHDSLKDDSGTDISRYTLRTLKVKRTILLGTVPMRQTSQV